MPDSRDSILRRYASGERSFRGEDYHGEGPERAWLDLREVDLSGADFSECYIQADFRDANLEGCRFEDANVKCSDFRGANLRNASFAKSAIDAAEFDGASLDGANFENAGAYGYTFKAGELP